MELPNLSDKSEKTEITPLFLDINTVDTTALKKLKGIGTFYAKKIVEQREKLGGYYSKEQLLELWNFKPEMLAEIKDQIHLGKNSINQINLNICEAKDLAYHPYLNWKQANAIIAYRNQHGNFQTVQEIQKSHLISSEICQRIAPYLTVE